MYLDGKYFIGAVLDISRKATVASRCFAGCRVQARNHCRNRCCGVRNYASDIRSNDALAAGVESPC